jgi:hypothetical protein
MKKSNKNFNAASLKLFIKRSFIFLLFILIFGFLGSYLQGILKNSEYFKIKDIITNEATIAEFSDLKDRNIFSIDLKKEAEYILGFCPDCKKVSIIRILPNRLYIYFLKRQPIAFIRLYKYFYVDQEGVLFESQDKPSLELPVISGLETKIFGPKPGKKYNLRELTFALSLIKEIKNNRQLTHFNIINVDVSKLSDVSVLLTVSGEYLGYSRDSMLPLPVITFEVKCSQDDFKNKINILGNLIAQTKKDLGNIKYIDIRFKEPVIKLKNVQ